jgi:hypothetical protein
VSSFNRKVEIKLNSLGMIGLYRWFAAAFFSLNYGLVAVWSHLVQMAGARGNRDPCASWLQYALNLLK